MHLNHTVSVLLGFFVCLGARQGYCVSAQVKGEAAIVGDFLNGVGVDREVYQGWRVPLGLALEVRPSDRLALHLDLRLGFNNYPERARSLGNSQNSGNSEIAPLGSASEGWSGKVDPLLNTIGFVEYAADGIGLFRAGRMPRHWGLGIWRDDGGRGPSPQGEWSPAGGTASISDALEYSLDFRNNVIFKAAWEKYNEGSPTARGDDADAWTLEIVVSNESTQVPANGLMRSVGIAYSRFKGELTSINFLDIFSKFGYGQFGVEGEVLYLDGKTSSSEYNYLGGVAECSVATPSGTCAKTVSRGIDSLGFIGRSHYVLSDNVSWGTYREIIGRRISSSQLPTSHVLGGWFGFVTGDAGAFETTSSDRTNDDIVAAPLNPNVRPGLLMFGAPVADSPGMPGAVLQNVWFLKGEYTYMSSGFGSVTPSVIWGNLNTTRKDGASTGPGRYTDLGIEVNTNYKYITEDNIYLGFEGGLWFPGAALAKEGSSGPGVVFGTRLMAGTSF